MRRDGKIGTVGVKQVGVFRKDQRVMQINYTCYECGASNSIHGNMPHLKAFHMDCRSCGTPHFIFISKRNIDLMKVEIIDTHRGWPQSKWPQR